MCFKAISLASMSMEKGAATVRTTMGDGFAHPRQHTGVEIPLKPSDSAHQSSAIYRARQTRNYKVFRL
jgi:hypothetical protein